MTESIFIGPEVDRSRIADDVILHPGCRISGANTSIGPGSILGAEAGVVLENCQLGRAVHLKGGFFSGAVFLEGSSMGSGAHIRAGTLLEEAASGAHSVGLKQTLLMPFVTLGSLINFCDILMAGGTSRTNHSEVGSSYIHFNFTPHQDKATASLVGDVPRGVLLNQSPIFLGGQGGLIGPSRLEYGSVVAAGGVCRKDLLLENQLYIPASLEEKTIPYQQGVYKKIKQIVKNNLIYIGQIHALKGWYTHIRILFLRDHFDHACHEGALNNLELVLTERINRLEQLAAKLDASADALRNAKEAPSAEEQEQRDFATSWKTIRSQLEQLNNVPPPPLLMNEFKMMDKATYLISIQNLNPRAQSEATAWLQCMVDEAAQWAKK